MSYPPIVLDRVASLPLYRQIEVELRRAILDGRIGPGTRPAGDPELRPAPGRRRGDRHDGVRPADRRGLPRGAAGPRDAGRPRGHAAGAEPAPRPGRRALAGGRGAARRRASGGRSSAARARSRGTTSAPGRRASTCSRRPPGSGCSRARGATSRPTPAPATSYRYPEGDPRLREELGAYLGMARAVRADRDQLVITAGVQGALATAIATWLAGGRPLAVEDPGSPYLLRTFAQAGVPLVHVPVDDRGLLVDRLPDGARRRAGHAVVAVPGRRHDAGRATDAAARAGRPRATRWSSRTTPTPSRATRGTRSRRSRGSTTPGGCSTWARSAGCCSPGCGSATRSCRRGAWTCSSPGRRRRTAGPGALEQRALALFIAEGHFERHLVRIRAHHAERQAALLDALAAELGTVVSARSAPAGAHLVVRIEDVHLTATELATRARALGRRGRAAVVLAAPPGRGPGAAAPLRAPGARRDPGRRRGARAGRRLEDARLGLSPKCRAKRELSRG